MLNDIKVGDVFYRVSTFHNGVFSYCESKVVHVYEGAVALHDEHDRSMSILRIAQPSRRGGLWTNYDHQEESRTKEEAVDIYLSENIKYFNNISLNLEEEIEEKQMALKANLEHLSKLYAEQEKLKQVLTFTETPLPEGEDHA